MYSARRPANRLLTEIRSGILEYERAREERRKREAIARCGTVAPWGLEQLEAIAKLYPSATPRRNAVLILLP